MTAPLSFEKWKGSFIRRWYDPPGGPMQHFEGTPEEFNALLARLPPHTRYGALAPSDVPFVLGETEILTAIEAGKDMSPEEHFNPINHPHHYVTHPSGVECIEITRHMNFNLGNAIKYIWRCKYKNGVEDLRKAIWYLEDEIKRLGK